MEQVVQILLLSVSLSIDALGIGLAYAAKGLRIPLRAKCTAGLMSLFIMTVSLAAGNTINLFLPPFIMKLLSCSILVLIGTMMIKKSICNPGETYDLDNSKCISGLEALLLGAALSMDTAAVGVAVGVGNIVIWPIPILNGLMQIMFLYAGELLARKAFAFLRWNEKISGIFSGCVMYLLAFLFFRA